MEVHVWKRLMWSGLGRALIASAHDPPARMWPTPYLPGETGSVIRFCAEQGRKWDLCTFPSLFQNPLTLKEMV